MRRRGRRRREVYGVDDAAADTEAGGGFAGEAGTSPVQIGEESGRAPGEEKDA